MTIDENISKHITLITYTSAFLLTFSSTMISLDCIPGSSSGCAARSIRGISSSLLACKLLQKTITFLIFSYVSVTSLWQNDIAIPVSKSQAGTVNVTQCIIITYSIVQWYSIWMSTKHKHTSMDTYMVSWPSWKLIIAYYKTTKYHIVMHTMLF